jgi:predicted nucleotidyltransferase
MPATFAELYAPLLKKDVFTVHARENLAQGADALTCALAYAEQGKPEFTLAYLLLATISDDEKREILAVSFDRRATISEEKAEQFDQQFHRPFPLIKLEAQKDRLAAQQVHQGRRVRRETAAPKMLRVS